jgi:hypothetical protein
VRGRRRATDGEIMDLGLFFLEIFEDLGVDGDLCAL